MKVLITGATSGIGRQLALDYASEGHQVWGIGRDSGKLRELESSGITTVELDLTNRQKTLEWFESIDGVDLAILSAGSCEYIDMPDFDSALVARIMRLNVETMATCVEGVLPHLSNSTSPHLVGISSSAAYLPLPRAEAYGASKAAVSYMFKTLRITLASYNIAVSLVCPGFVKTPLTDRNDFPMPFLISTEQASKTIRKGILKKKGEIHFPGVFTYMLKTLSLLPQSIWLKIAQKMVKK